MKGRYSGDRVFLRTVLHPRRTSKSRPWRPSRQGTGDGRTILSSVGEVRGDLAVSRASPCLVLPICDDPYLSDGAPGLLGSSLGWETRRSGPERNPHRLGVSRASNSSRRPPLVLRLTGPRGAPTPED